MNSGDGLSLPVAVNVLIQAASKGQSAGAYDLREAALIHEAIDAAGREARRAVGEQAEVEEKLKQVVRCFRDFRCCQLQISQIYRLPGMPGSFEADNGDLDNETLDREPGTRNAGEVTAHCWEEVLLHLDGLKKTQQQVNEIFYSPGFPGFAQAEKSFTEKIGGR